eukprot:gnl/Spiro4/24921_TR12391_c0_g1_i1.p1 gnl/Spiro4/24921_TR12391_c0_g1~~gnl/Spiro4/24921_TR12391_c0_g1_i1.p1  ORF type:complete len:386 (-),score=122.74 gnl/Spiro4/24921_TR12391_c0_g1_i1:88-1197(-)
MIGAIDESEICVPAACNDNTPENTAEHFHVCRLCQHTLVSEDSSFCSPCGQLLHQNACARRDRRIARVSAARSALQLMGWNPPVAAATTTSLNFGGAREYRRAAHALNQLHEHRAVLWRRTLLPMRVDSPLLMLLWVLFRRRDLSRLPVEICLQIATAASAPHTDTLPPPKTYLATHPLAPHVLRVVTRKLCEILSPLEWMKVGPEIHYREGTTMRVRVTPLQHTLLASIRVAVVCEADGRFLCNSDDNIITSHVYGWRLPRPAGLPVPPHGTQTEDWLKSWRLPRCSLLQVELKFSHESIIFSSRITLPEDYNTDVQPREIFARVLSVRHPPAGRVVPYRAAILLQPASRSECLAALWDMEFLSSSSS